MRDTRDNIRKTQVSAYAPGIRQRTTRPAWRYVLSISLLLMLIPAAALAAAPIGASSEKQLSTGVTPIRYTASAAGSAGADYSAMPERPSFAIPYGGEADIYWTAYREYKRPVSAENSPGERGLYEPPFPPESPYPAPGTENISTNTTLNWTGQDTEQYPLLYEVYFGTSPDTLEPVASLITYPGYDPGTLEQNTTYYWQIYATDGDMYYVPGGVWNYTTGSSEA